MKLMIALIIIMLIAECVLVAIIAYNKGVKSVGDTYKRSLMMIRENYESLARQFEEMANDYNSSTESVQDTESRCR